MIAFAANSILCRLAFKNTSIDAATFTNVRLVSGAIMLWLIVPANRQNNVPANWISAFALFAYAASFSFAYITLSASTGALLLFGAVQLTMILPQILAGENLSIWKIAGIICAFCGLILLVLPGLTAPPLTGAALMTTAGIAWGVYSLRGRGTADPEASTLSNFLRAVPMAIILNMLFFSYSSFDFAGIVYAMLSGALTSALGYILWYKVLPSHNPTGAATVQLSVPVIAALGGIAILDEQATIRLIVSSLMILGGIGLVFRKNEPLSITDQARPIHEPVSAAFRKCDKCE